MIASDDRNDGTTQNSAKSFAEETRDKASGDDAFQRQASDASPVSGDTATVPGDRPVRTTRDANESIYDAASRKNQGRTDRTPITIEPAEFVELSDEHRREAVAALTTLLAPLAARLTTRA